MSAAGEPTAFPELDDVLAELVDGARSVLGDTFCGAYLHGSFATGEADEFSDVDFVVVTHEELTAEQERGVQLLHRRLYTLGSPWAQHLEGSYIPRRQLRRVDWSQRPFLFLDNGASELVRDSHCNTAVVRWLLREQGVTLAGPDPKTLVDPVSASDLRREALTRIRDYADWASEPDDDRPMSRWKQPYLVLTFCRLLFTLVEGGVASKRRAAEWALRALDPEWAPLIRQAIADRADPWERAHQAAEPDAAARTLRFARYVVAESARPRRLPGVERLASAPVTWGVWERMTGRDDFIAAPRLLRTVAGLGYRGIELGPPGYLEPAAVAESGLELVGGFAPLHLDDEDAFAADLAEWLDPIAAALAETGRSGPVVLADAGTPERLTGAGRPVEQARTALTGDRLARALDRLTRAAERCRAVGVDAVFHHHTATYFETPEEIAAVVDGTDIALCFDTGHAAVGGGDAVELARRYASRIGHLHLKDVDPVLLARVRAGEVALEQAWGDGIFCPFGEGMVDLGSVLALPELQGFDGWIVLEQDRVSVRADGLDAVRTVEEANLRYVREALALPRPD